MNVMNNELLSDLELGDLELSDLEFDLLNTMLLEYTKEDAQDNAILCISELSGFFTAILSAPTMILPSQWLEFIMKDKKIRSSKKLEQFTTLLLKFYNQTNLELQGGLDTFSPVFEEMPATGYTVTEEWCFGYMFGLEVANWTTYPVSLKKYIEIILQQTDIHRKSENTDGEIVRAALYIHDYVRKTLYNPAVKKSKIGVNAPCPCGSGKKYKKCCLH